MLESKMWNKLKYVADCNHIFVRRLENRTGRFPDIYFSTEQMNGLIELKNIRYAKEKLLNSNNSTIYTSTTDYIVKIPFRLGQYAFIKEHLKYNKCIFLIGSVGDKAWFIMEGNEIREEYSVGELSFNSPIIILKDLIWRII